MHKTITSTIMGLTCLTAGACSNLIPHDIFLVTDALAETIYQRSNHGNKLAHEAIINCKNSIRKTSFNFAYFEGLSEVEKRRCINTQIQYLKTGDFAKLLPPKDSINKDHFKQKAVDSYNSYMSALYGVANHYDLDLTEAYN